MTVQDIKTMVLSVDPKAKHYFADKKGDAFTVWGEYQRAGQGAEDRHDYGWKFEIDRYTRDEEDTVPDMIEQILIDHPGVAYTYQVYYDHTARYIVHVFDCEGY